MNRKLIFLTIIFSFVGFSGGFLTMQLFIIKPTGQHATQVASLTETLPASLPVAETSIDANEQMVDIETPPDVSIPSEPSQSPSQAPAPVSRDTTDVKKVEKSDCPQPKKEYDDYALLDVGQVVAIPDASYIPPDLVELDKDITKFPNTCLRKDAADALTLMIEAAKKDGYSVKVSSAFRSYDTQKFLLDRSIQSGNKNARKLIAKPGYSEHQLGMAIDVTSPSINNVSAAKKFEISGESKWLEDNAYLYGFVESYPKDREEITGYLYESWHYRYVGPEVATAIREKNMTPNQYLKEERERQTAEENTAG